jgi:glycosyltransferase involved in cell wall biosynthesis
MPELRKLVQSEGIAAGVNFRGWVDQTKLVDTLVDFDLMTFPSIREFGGAVALEAMAIGLVPMVVGYGGPGELVTDQTGYLVPLGSRDEIIVRLREMLRGIIADPGQIESKSAAAIHRVEQNFTWEAKAGQILQVYRWVLGLRPEKPNLGMPFGDGPVARD